LLDFIRPGKPIENGYIRETSAAWDRGVNAIWDDVCQTVAGEGGDEPKGASGTRWAISRRSWSASEALARRYRATAELLQMLEMPLIAVAVEALRGELGGPRVRVREDWR